MGKKKKVSTNPAPKAYTVEELEQKIESAENKIVFIANRIERIKPYLAQSQMELEALVSRRTRLEDELKKYSGFLAQVKFSLKAVFSKADNEAKINQEEISKSLSQLEPLIAEKEHEIKCFEEAIVANKQKIEEYKSDSSRWSTKLKKRANADFASSEAPKEPGDMQ